MAKIKKNVQVATNTNTENKPSTPAIMVVGAGIAGMQAALDIANQNIHVYLVERAPAIGGAMAKLDKTFPTNDCAICIEAPKMVEVGRNPNIELITYSNIEKVDGSIGHFEITIKKHPRYIDSTKCTGCGACFEICPIKIPNKFDNDLGTRGAIYRYFAQAVPNVATIDKNYCINCGLCELVCAPEAIKREQKIELMKIQVGSIILATGFEEYDPSELTALGYGKYSNVITAMQLERLLCASGPTGGHIRKPSDGKVPKSIAWIQCVGSRNFKINRPYCSRACCMWTTKEAMISKDHHPELTPYVFYMDIRTYGKGFEEYYKRAKNEIGINYIRSRPAEIIESDDNKLIIFYENIEQKKASSLKVDMVVLTSGMKPSDKNKELAEILKVELDDYGYFKEKDPILSPLETNVNGIYLCGCCVGPKDIPDSVAQASGAAAKAIAAIKDADFNLTYYLDKVINKEKIVPKINTEGPPRVGVFVCHCGRNIGGYLDVKAVTDFASKLPNVEFTKDNLFTCSESTQSIIKNAIEEKNLNRVVVASCSPRTHESLFKVTCKDAGLNENLFEMVNIRDQCSWVHSYEWDNGTEKAKNLVNMAVSKSRLLEPKETRTLKVVPEALVIGAGISGLTAANDLGEMGFKTHLVEKESKIGGMLNNLNHIYPTDIPAEEVLVNIMNKIKANKNVNLYLKTQIKTVSGYIGNYNITLQDEKNEWDIKVGTVIIAIGAEEFKPFGYYGYSKNNRIMTLLEYDEALRNKKLPDKVNNIVIMSCVGSRETTESNRTYCCRIGCGAILGTVKNIIKDYPKANIYILHRDFRVIEKTSEEYYRELRESPKTRFIRYNEENKPKVTINDGQITIDCLNIFTDENISIQSDLLLLTTPLINPSDSKEVSQLLKVPLGANGFFQEAHVKLRPLDFATDGVFICGSAHSPKNISDSIAQASGAAARASIPMRIGYVTAESNTAKVNDELCAGCGTCGNVCPYGAISFKINETNNFLVSEVNEAVCKGCGVCAVSCPSKAIEMHGFTDLQILEQISQALHGPNIEGEPKIVGFCCNWCSYAGADLAGISRFQYPSNIRIIRVMCSGRIDPFFIIWAFMEGADGIFLSGCHPGDCHYISGNIHAKERIEKLRNVLSNIGIDSQRLNLEWVSASEGKRFSELVTRFTNEIKNLKPFKPFEVKLKSIGEKIVAN